MSIHKKIHAVMQDVTYIVKDGVVNYENKKSGVKIKYKGVREEVVTTAVRDSMVEHGLIVFPIAQVHKREGTLTTLDVTYRFLDIEDESFIDVVSAGTGVDTQDKGVGMAMTYAYKYVFLRTFAIPTGEDPDRISSAENDDKDAKRKNNGNQNGNGNQNSKPTGEEPPPRQHTKEEADRACIEIKHMLADGENVLPEAKLNDIQEELSNIKSKTEAVNLCQRFKAYVRKYNLEAVRDNEKTNGGLDYGN